jgi:hypothetical protein
MGWTRTMRLSWQKSYNTSYENLGQIGRGVAGVSRTITFVRSACAGHPVAAHDVSRIQLRWNGIVEEANSDDERKWRLAILEADIMLNELLDVQGYRGETMADKMKKVDRGSFRSIDAAWEAHRVRNQIAHQGSAHLLSGREARHVIGLYEEVFREFKVVE